MVSTSISTHTANVGLCNASVNKCRYKTGKCSHMRSSKRNGQLHQLCLFHREKANRIQRRFDRQKRRAARAKFVRDLHDPASPTSVPKQSIAYPAVSPTGSNCSTSSLTSFSSFDSDGVNLYSPASDPVCVDIFVDGLANVGNSLDMPLPTSCHQSYLSSDEIAFLCAAILE